MNIELYQFEVMEAINDYINKKYNFSMDMEQIFEHPMIEYSEYERVYKKDVNGKVKKRKDGSWILDEKESTLTEKRIHWDELGCIKFYIKGADDE